MARIRTFRRWDDFAGKLHTFGRWERPERKENAATDAVANMTRILTFRRWDDFAGKLHTFRRCERPERKENADTDAVADMARIRKGGTISQENCTPSEGGKGKNGRKTRLQTLWRTWREYSPSEGGTISQENYTPSEGGKDQEKEDGYLTADGYLKLMSKRPTHSPWAPAWTTTTSRPTRFW